MSTTLSTDKVTKEDEVARVFSPKIPTVDLRCPICGTESYAVAYRSLARDCNAIRCGGCSFVFAQEQGIWITLPPDRQGHFARFMREYDQVRRAEGRGNDDPEFYLALPYRDLTGRNSWQWAIRSRTYRYIERRILPGLREAANPSLTVLDLGAGNAWLSYRLTALGHRPIAVDLLTNKYDGLGAAIHYRRVLPGFFPRFQSELDKLPFAESQFDCVIFNASFHYSENYERTLAEAVRCTRPGGTVIVADSPTYSCEECGQKMVQERREFFQKAFGFKSDALASCEYLTAERLIALEARHDIEWRTHRVWYGFQWAFRPLVAKLKRRREPSQFWIYTAKVKEQ
jgi:SAM-dependent methyltransferase